MNLALPDDASLVFALLNIVALADYVHLDHDDDAGKYRVLVVLKDGKAYLSRDAFLEIALVNVARRIDLEAEKTRDAGTLGVLDDLTHRGRP